MARRPPQSFGAALGANVKARREVLGLSQAELARRIGMRPPKLNALERGRSPRGPAPETIARLAAELRVSPAEILPVSQLSHA